VRFILHDPKAPGSLRATIAFRHGDFFIYNVRIYESATRGLWIQWPFAYWRGGKSRRALVRPATVTAQKFYENFLIEKYLKMMESHHKVFHGMDKRTLEPIYPSDDEFFLPPPTKTGKIAYSTIKRPAGSKTRKKI
jgi:hypothetical protein